MNIYLAARYSRAVEMLAKAATLEGMGFDVTSRWIYGGHQITDDQLNDGETEATLGARYADDDVIDLTCADICLFFSETQPRSPTRGGRHVEFGMALALKKRCIVVGPRENVFHCLPHVEQCDTWDQAKALLEDLVEAKV